MKKIIAQIQRLLEEKPRFRVTILEDGNIQSVHNSIRFQASKDNRIVKVMDGSTGMGHTPFANIDKTGSVGGMRSQGYWGKDDKVVTALGGHYNLSARVLSDDLDYLALRMIESGRRFEGLNPGESTEILLRGPL